MAVCDYCGQEMTDPTTKSCRSDSIIFPDGECLRPIPYAPEYGGPDRRCHDCNVTRGGFHHAGCDMERCPRCGGQLISCGCLSAEMERQAKP